MATSESSESTEISYIYISKDTFNCIIVGIMIIASILLIVYSLVVGFPQN
jgi:hypothetical protein